MRGLVLTAEWDPRPDYTVTEWERTTGQAVTGSSVWRSPRPSVEAAPAPELGGGGPPVAHRLPEPVPAPGGDRLHDPRRPGRVPCDRRQVLLEDHRPRRALRDEGEGLRGRGAVRADQCRLQRDVPPRGGIQAGRPRRRLRQRAERLRRDR